MKTTYDYNEAITEDIKEYIKNEIDLTEYTDDRDGLETFLSDELWTVDSVTGNASGSYTFNRYTAKEYLDGNEVVWYGFLYIDFQPSTANSLYLRSETIA